MHTSLKQACTHWNSGFILIGIWLEFNSWEYVGFADVYNLIQHVETEFKSDYNSDKCFNIYKLPSPQKRQLLTSFSSDTEFTEFMTILKIWNTKISISSCSSYIFLGQCHINCFIAMPFFTKIFQNPKEEEMFLKVVNKPVFLWNSS